MMENNQNTQNKFEPIEAKFTERRDYWMKWIEDMNESLKSIDTVINLQGVVYTKRQEAVENYHSLAATVAKWSKKYKEDSARLYKEIRLMKTAQGASTFMFTNESAIREQIDAQLSDDKYLIVILESHLGYLDNTIKTIDGIIYAINNRIKIEEIKIGK
jgi:hypothetical protein